MRYKYTDEQIEFVRSIAPGRYNDEIAQLFNKRFGTHLSKEIIRSLKANHKIQSNVPRKKPNPDAGLFTKEQKEFIKNNVKGKYNDELADLINKTFGLSITAQQMNTYKANHNLTSGLTGHFEKGQEPWNKGMKGLQMGGKETQFKKGRVSENYKPVGSERLDKKDGYTLIKVQDEGTWPERWRHKHVVVWENHHNKEVPENHVITFADSNKRNLDINNLILISRSELVRMNQQDLFSNDPEITKAGLNIVRLGVKVTDHELYGGDREAFQKYIEIAEKRGLSKQTFILRLKRGWSLGDALNKPLNFRFSGSNRRVD